MALEVLHQGRREKVDGKRDFSEKLPESSGSVCRAGVLEDKYCMILYISSH